MTGRRLALWFAGAFAVGLVLALPLRLLLLRLPLPPGLSAATIEGSVWRGQARRLAWRGADFGDVRIHLSPGSLLAGRARLWLHAGEGRFALVVAGRLRGLDAADGPLPLPPLHGVALRAWLQDARLLFDEDGCRAAGGRVRVEATLPHDTVAPLLLAGTPVCEGRAGQVVLTPADADGPLRLEATLRIEADGHLTLQTTADSPDPAVRAALLAAGFQDAPGGLSRVDRGDPWR